MKRALMLIAGIIAWFAAAAGAPRVFFVNIYPGDKVYELEGHSALVVDEGGPAMAYNYGVFDFNSPNFIYRFVKGETDYMLAAYPFTLFMHSYREQGRRTVAHELDLDSIQATRLIAMLKENAEPANRVYRYNYVKDNCATRPLAMVEKAIGDSIELAPAPFEAQPLLKPTFRNVMRHYHRNYPWYQFGIDLALGSGIDYPISRREISFAPAELDVMLSRATAGGRPLVRSTRILTDTPADAVPLPATPWYLTPITVCWLFFAIAVAVTIAGARRKRLFRGFDAAFFGIMGLTGCVLTFLIFVSVHEATSPNWLYAWLNPLCLTVPALSWWRSARPILRTYYIIYAAIMLLLISLWWALPQSANPAFFPLMGAALLRSAAGAFRKNSIHVSTHK